jgi:excisionase family DNA binding protein
VPRQHPSGAEPPRRYASIQAACDLYDVDHKTVRRWIASGLIRGYRMGDRLVKVDLNEIDAKVVQVIPAAAERKPLPVRRPPASAAKATR